MKSEGIGDTIYVGPEAEFFVFDDVKYKADPYNTGFKLDSSELPSNDDTDYETGNLGHRPRIKGGYFPVPPIDSAQDMRSEMLTVLAEYLGSGGDASLGRALIAAQSTADGPRLWYLALVSGAGAGLAYALIGLVGRFATPWSSGTRDGGRP